MPQVADRYFFYDELANLRINVYERLCNTTSQLCFSHRLHLLRKLVLNSSVAWHHRTFNLVSRPDMFFQISTCSFLTQCRARHKDQDILTPCSLSRIETAIPNPKFGVDIVSIRFPEPRPARDPSLTQPSPLCSYANDRFVYRLPLLSLAPSLLSHPPSLRPCKFKRQASFSAG